MLNKWGVKRWPTNPWNGTISFIAKKIISATLWYEERSIQTLFSRDWKKLSNYDDIAEFIKKNYPWIKSKNKPL